MEKERIRRRDLPHWDVPGAAYFVTTCLAGSIPASGLLELARSRELLQKQPRPAGTSLPDWRVLQWKRQFVEVEKWLDGQPDRHDLARPELAEVVENAMLHFAGQRYDLIAYVVMPSHVHWVFQPRSEWVKAFPSNDERSPRQQILYSLNRFTATHCNRILQRTGSFWQSESYDHWVRDVEAMERIIHYIEANPVKAGLVTHPHEWLYSSASRRLKLGLQFGEPLTGLVQSGLES